MQSTGTSVIDGDDENDNVTNTGLTFKRLDVAAVAEAILPPKINDVILRGTSWAIANDRVFSELVAAGDQLRPISTQGANQIEIQFSEHVRKKLANGTISDIASTTTDGNLLLKLEQSVRDGDSVINSTVAATSFSYNATTHVGTWTFPTLVDGKYAIHLLSPTPEQAGIVDATGEALDGDWTNDDNGTPDNPADDAPRAFEVGDGTEGSEGNAFRLHFALLGADFNGDGYVDGTDFLIYQATVSSTTDLRADANGNGVVDSADLDAWEDNQGDFLPLRKIGGADLNDDEIVDGFDIAMWENGFGGGIAGDVDGDGDSDGADFLMIQRVMDDFSVWYVDPTPAVAAATIGAAPQVTNVYVSGSLSTHSVANFSQVVGSGQQLRTVPVGGADTISIVFSENVNVAPDSLLVVGLETGNVPTLAEFSYNPTMQMATWRFENWALRDQYVLSLADSVTDVDGNWLDGEWTNPESITTVNSAVSEFPSGDGVAGGRFNFVMTLLPGDANGDAIVNSADYAIFLANAGAQTGKKFVHADFDGDGDVDGDDYDLGAATDGTNFQTLWMRADLDGDFDVDADDIDVIAQNGNMTGATWADGDLNGDGVVDMDDLDLAYAQYGIALSVVS
jgi:hypothetical protein